MRVKWTVFTLLITAFTAIAVAACVGLMNINSYDRALAKELSYTRQEIHNRMEIYQQTHASLNGFAVEELQDVLPRMALQFDGPPQNFSTKYLQNVAEQHKIKAIHLLDQNLVVVASSDPASLEIDLKQDNPEYAEILMMQMGKNKVVMGQFDMSPTRGQPRLFAYFSKRGHNSFIQAELDIKEAFANRFNDELSDALFTGPFQMLADTNPKIKTIDIYSYSDRNSWSILNYGDSLDPSIAGLARRQGETSVQQGNIVQQYQFISMQDENRDLPIQLISRIDFDLSERRQMIISTITHTLLVLPPVIILAFLVGLFLVNRDLIRPIHQITEGLQRVIQGDYSSEIKLQKTQKELRQIAETINVMLGYIRAREQQLIESRDQLELRVQERTSELNASKERYKTLATTDELTGLCNRRRFMSLATEELVRAERYDHPWCVVMLDIDHFKSVNDTYGHDNGDEILKQLGRVAATVLRQTDTFARLGGEEFAMLLPETDLEGAQAIAERMREAVEAAETPQLDQPEHMIKITVSQGVACYHPEHRNSMETMLKAADKALYRAKGSGRNRVCVAEDYSSQLADQHHE